MAFSANLYKLIVIIQAIILACYCQKQDGCDLGWYRYEDSKCVYLVNIESTYIESKYFCDKQFGANMLNITDESERKYWSFQLIRYFNVSHNVWLQKPDVLKNSDQCLALRSKYANDKYKIGTIVKQNCDGSGVTVCEIATNKPVASSKPAQLFNPNNDMVDNKQIKLANGSLSQAYTGVYYAITSKYKNTPFSNRIIANGKCKINDQGSSCKTMYVDKDIHKSRDNYYMFTSDNSQDFQIQRMSSSKLLIYDPDHYLSNYECGNLGTKMCKMLLKDDNANDLWKLTQYNNSEYYMIQSNHMNYTLGFNLFDVGKNGTVGFGLYDAPGHKNKVDDMFLFKILPLNYTLNVELYSIQFEQSLSEIIADNKKEISLVEMTTINNNSPSTLSHEVEHIREITESFSTSFGISQSFMDSFSNSIEIGNKLTDTNSKSSSFSDATSRAVQSTLSSSISNSNSASETHSVTDTQKSVDKKEESSGVPIFYQVKTTTTVENTHETTDSNTKTKENSEQTGNSHETNDKTEQEKTETNGNTHSNSSEKTNSTTNTKQTVITTDKRLDKTNTNKKTYSIFKTVSLPPYSAVKVSSYANWISDLVIPYNLTLKFTVRSMRNQKDRRSSNNFWRTMDSAFVKHVMKKQGFNGNIIRELNDTVYGNIQGSLKASIGLESVFSAKTIKIYNDNNDD